MAKPRGDFMSPANMERDANLSIDSNVSTCEERVVGTG
jgi:hypothetical protein